MVAFAPVVQADFSGTAFGGVPTWTDISRFARLKAQPIAINKWRQDQMSDVAPSTMTLLLDNDDLIGDATAPNAGRFTPGLSTSPWYPHILPGVRIRVGVTVNATTYWRFDGYVDTWNAAYDNGEFSVCSVAASDWLAWVGTMDALRSIYLEEVLVDGPIALYPLTEPASAAGGGDISGKSAPTLNVAQTTGGADHTFANAAGLPTDGTATLTLNATLGTTSADDLRGDYLVSAGSLVFPSGLNFTLETVVTINPSIVNAMSRIGGLVVVALPLSSGSFYAMRLLYSAGSVVLADATGAAVSAVNLADGKLHHIALVNDKLGANNSRVYLDGALAGVGTALATLTTATTCRIWAGFYDPSQAPSSAAAQAPFRGGLGYIAIYAGALSATRIAQHAQAATTGFPGEVTSAHISRLAAYRPSATVATVQLGQGAVSLHTFTGQTLSQALLDTAKAEGTLVYVDGTGNLQFVNRTGLRNPHVAITLDITAQQTTADLNVLADRQLLLNDVTITRPQGAAQRVIDQTSKNTHGTKALNEPRIISTDIDALNAAGWLVANGKTVGPRSPSLAVDLLTEPSLTVAANVLSIAQPQGWKISLINPPTSAPALDVFVQGCVDTIGVDVFTVAFYVSPLPRPTLRFDPAADAVTKLDSGNVFAW